MKIKPSKILLGITGSIAAYKSADLVRNLIKQGFTVRVVMTDAATKFITPLTLQTLSKQPVYRDLFGTEIEHINLARWADTILIAPATADFITRLTYGHANDLLSTICLATTAPIILAPAMNQHMWNATITQENCQKLRHRNIKFFGPATGSQACGEIGTGRMLEPSELIQCLQNLILKQSSPIQGKKILITAGPTREDIDPVRFISNRSSGRMGYAIANAAAMRGASVILISGPTALTSEVPTISVNNAKDMLKAVMENVSNTDIFIAVAAVADYRPIQQVNQKIKKKSELLQLDLEPTEDILATVANLPKPPFTVGFAAETNNLDEYAYNKLKTKKLNMIAANLVGNGNLGFDSMDNKLKVFWNDGELELPRCSKTVLADKLFDVIIQRFLDRCTRMKTNPQGNSQI
ncbi:bifunctional phosphopantothenoylcysteine decarboxylase/phosphopantothenate--cysteine ligase CoaBC [Thiotrichales bacterium HSG1]|nr:bifunctional phosphopantothenoylcysteine decarboxylase/phosphopantothenate--cysteine ligase CoaBC [Thiotrichales bacterium HSG1]